MPNLEPVALDKETLDWARRRVQEIKGFYLHAAIYGLINIGLIFVYAFGSAASFWPIWPILGWGVGLLAHGLAVYRLVPALFTRDWEEKKIRQLVEKEKARQARSG